MTNHSGLSRHNLTNESHHAKKSEAAKFMFGFDSYGETITHIKSFFTQVKIEFPELFCENRKIVVKPSFLTEFEHILIAKCLCRLLLTEPNLVWLLTHRVNACHAQQTNGYLCGQNVDHVYPYLRYLQITMQKNYQMNT